MRPIHHPIIQTIRKRIVLAGWVALIFLLIGQLGAYYWIFELFSHFTLFYTAVLLLACFAAYTPRSRLVFVLTTVACLIWAGSSLFIRLTEPFSHCFSPRFTLVSYNLWMNNPQKQVEAQKLQEMKADTYFLTEYTAAWESHLQNLTSLNGCSHQEDSPFGIALFSKMPLSECTIQYTQSSPYTPYVRAVLENGIVIYGIHPPPPIHQELAQERNLMLEELAALIRAEESDVIVVGDLNMSAFSPKFWQFTSSAQLYITKIRGMPTWQPGFIDLDHILVTNRWAAIASGSYPWTHSDHRAIWLEYAEPLPRTQQKSDSI